MDEPEETIDSAAAEADTIRSKEKQVVAPATEEQPSPTLTEQKANVRLSEAAIIAISPAVFYIWCYAYQSEYEQRFGVPAYLVTITVTNLLVFGVCALCASAGFLYAVRQFAVMDEEDESSTGLMKVSSVGCKYSLLLAGAFIAQRFSGLWMILIVAGIVPLADGLRAWLNNKHNNPHLKSFASMAKSGKAGSKYWFDKTVGGLLFRTLAFVLIGMFFSAAVGENRANKQVKFTVLDSSRDFAIVLSVTDADALCVLYDPLTKTPKNKFLLIKLSGEKPLALKHLSIGPMHLPKESTGIAY